MTKASKGKTNAIIELSTIMALHKRVDNEWCSDSSCETCGTYGEYDVEWPCATYTAAARTLKHLEPL